MKNLKRAAAVSIMAGGLVATGATLASATDQGAHHDHTHLTSARAEATAIQSPGIGSGNLAKLPVHVPLNAMGNTATVIGGLNPVFGEDGVNP